MNRWAAFTAAWLAAWALACEPAFAAVVQIQAKDSGGTARSFNVTTNTDLTGNLDWNNVICDQAAGTTCASVGTAGSPSTNALTVQPVTLGNGTSANAARVTISNDSTGTVAVTNAGTFAVQATLQASATTAIGKIDPNTIATWGLAPVGGTSSSPTNALAAGCQFNSSAPTFTTGNTGAWQCTAAGSGHVTVDNANANGQALAANSSPVVEPVLTNGGAAVVKGGVGVVNGGSNYQEVAASSTATVLQTSTGAAGDYLSHCVIYPATTGAGAVTVFDNTNSAANNVIQFVSGTLSNLAPIAVPVGAVSVNGAWKVTTGTNVAVVCFGKFS